MPVLLPAFLLMAQAATTQTVDFPILNQRPSKIMKFLDKMPDLSVKMKADDLAGKLILTGSPAEVAEMKTRISLFDIKPRKVGVDMRVESQLDHAEWSANLTMTNNRSWTGSDEGTSAELKISPRLNDDGTLTLFINLKTPDTAAPLSMVTRVKLNEKQTFLLKAGTGDILSGSDIDPKLKGTRITFTYVDRE